MNTIYIQTYTSICGELILGSYGKHLCLCDWRVRQNRRSIDFRLQKGLNATYQVLAPNPYAETEPNQQSGDEGAVLATAKQQLDEYFSGNRTEFDIPLLTVGTDFQKQVWAQLQSIPYGETSTYSRIAAQIEKREAVRAVANANGANALSIFLPCHRIIGSAGQLTGYAGGILVKQRLLTIENDAFALRA